MTGSKAGFALLWGSWLAVGLACYVAYAGADLTVRIPGALQTAMFASGAFAYGVMRVETLRRAPALWGREALLFGALLFGGITGLFTG